MIFYDGLIWVKNIMRDLPRNIFQEKGSSFFHCEEMKERKNWEAKAETYEEVMISCGLSMADEKEDHCSTFQEIDSANSSEVQSPFFISHLEELGAPNFVFFQKKEPLSIDPSFLASQLQNSDRFFSKTNKLTKRINLSPEEKTHSEGVTSAEECSQAVSSSQKSCRDDINFDIGINFFSLLSHSEQPSQNLKKALFSIFHRAGPRLEEPSRQGILSRFRCKKKSRSFGIKYKSRQRVALGRQRLKGRFTTSLSMETDLKEQILNSEKD